MFADVTTAETLARHRAAELERRIDLARRRAQQPAPGPAAERRGRHAGRVLSSLGLARQHHAAPAH